MSNRLRVHADRLDVPGIFIPGSNLTPPRPPEPERPGRHEPVHLHIEIVLRLAPPVRRPRVHLVWWLLFGLILWSVLA